MKKTTLSHTILPEDYDIYNEIDLEDLHGPAAAQTIPLDVQDTDAVVNGDKETTSAKGVMPGRSAEVSQAVLIRVRVALSAVGPAGDRSQ
jgi:transcription initiation factor TFIIH subunit 1